VKTKWLIFTWLGLAGLAAHAQTAELVLPRGPLFAEPSGAHLKIVAGSAPVCLHMLEVTRD